MNVKSIFDRYKVRIEDDRIYDPIRQKFVHLTPEELVRQKTVKFLTRRLGVPEDRLIIERGLNTLSVLGIKRRIDIGVFDDEGLLMAVIECKASLAHGSEAAFKQAQGYLLDLNTRYFFVTDGITMDGWYYDTEQNIQLKNIPGYDSWYEYPVAGETGNDPF